MDQSQSSFGFNFRVRRELRNANVVDATVRNPDPPPTQDDEDDLVSTTSSVTFNDDYIRPHVYNDARRRFRESGNILPPVMGSMDEEDELSPHEGMVDHAIHIDDHVREPPYAPRPQVPRTISKIGFEGGPLDKNYNGHAANQVNSNALKQFIMGEQTADDEESIAEMEENREYAHVAGLGYRSVSNYPYRYYNKSFHSRHSRHSLMFCFIRSCSSQCWWRYHVCSFPRKFCTFFRVGIFNT